MNSSFNWPGLLREYRETRGLKQQAAAADLGVSQATYSRWERGATVPPVAMRNRLLNELLRARLPHTSEEWLSTFRKLPFPAAVVSKDNIINALSAFINKGARVQPSAGEGRSVEDIVEGEALEVAKRVRETGMFEGHVLCVEGCIQVRFLPGVDGGEPFHLHYVGWPQFAGDGEIVMVIQGVEVSEEEARRVRERLGGFIRIDTI